MTETASLVIKVDSSGASRATADLNKLDRAAGNSEKAASKLGKAWGIGLGAAAVAGVGLATAAFGKFVKNTIDLQNEQAMLAARIKSTGGVAGQTMASLGKMADEMRRTTAVTGDQISKAQDLLLTFTNIRGAIYDDAMPALLDMAVAMRQDTGSAAIQLGKALNDPILGVSSLGRAGVQFSKDQKAMIKSLVETGNVAGAQRIILRELETQFGGSAAAARDTLGGALTNLRETFDELLEGRGDGNGVRGARDAIEQLADTLGSSETKAAFDSIVSGIASTTSALAAAIPQIIAWSRQLEIGLGLSRDAAGQQGGTIFDIGQGLARGASSAYEYSAGALTGDAARRQQAVLNGRSADEQVMAGIGFGNKFTKTYTNPGAMPSYLSGPEYLTGNAPFSAVGPKPFSAVGKKPGAGLVTAATGGDGGGASAIRERVAATKELTEAQKAYNEQEEVYALIAEETDQYRRDGVASEYASAVAKEQGIAATDELIESMEFELSLIGMSNEARAKAIALRWADKDATEAQIAAIGELAVATERAVEQQQFADQAQRSLTNAVTDYATGAKSAKEAFGDFADSLFERAVQFMADKAIQAMFDSFNGKEGGSKEGSKGFDWGNMFSSIMGASGGKREFGGPVMAGSMYEVGEKNKPELFRSGGKQYMIPGNNGAVVPMKGQGSPTNITINVPNLVQYRTAAQIAQETAAAQGRAQARNR